MLTKQQLHEMALSATAEVMSGYPHMIEVWKATLGGYVLPQLAKLDPESVAGNSSFEAIIKEYSKEKIESLFKSGETIEIIKEVPKIVEKTVLVRTGEKVTHRRLKGKIEKISRKKRALTCEERDMVIRVFNDRQDMLDKTSEVFKTLTESFNEGHAPDNHISAPQLAGYWSSLCTWATKSEGRRAKWIETSIRREIFSIEPIFTPSFISAICENYKAKQKEKEERAKDHREIRETGVRKKIIISEEPAEAWREYGTPIVTGSKTPDVLPDLKDIDLSDIF